jgi:hypothetical protein
MSKSYTVTYYLLLITYYLLLITYYLLLITYYLLLITYYLLLITYRQPLGFLDSELLIVVLVAQDRQQYLPESRVYHLSNSSTYPSFKISELIYILVLITSCILDHTF